MKLSALGEDKLVQRLTRRLPGGKTVLIGPGDDCAVVRRGKLLELLKTDCIVEGIHFLRKHPAKWIGWKALCRNISDIAAMGGEPREALVTVAAPKDLEVRFLDCCFQGIAAAAKKYEVAVVGGETSRSPGPLFISIALTGVVEPKRLVLRSGGRPGDTLFVTGKLGGSIGGRHLKFQPRLPEARWLVSHFRINAMMDLSDGLGKDLPRLANASGCGFNLDTVSVPRARGVSVDAAITDGEDYELLFAVSPAVARRLKRQWKFQLPLTEIGILTAAQRRSKLQDGYDHFA